MAKTVRGQGFQGPAPVFQKCTNGHRCRSMTPAFGYAAESFLSRWQREKVCEILQQAGYQVLIARDGEEALRTAFRDTGPIQLLLTDVVMPRDLQVLNSYGASNLSGRI